MKQSQMRVFTENGVQYCFNRITFRSLVDRYAKENGISKGQVADDISKHLHVTTDAVNKWKYGKNGPADMDTIKEIAVYLHVDWLFLVKKEIGGSAMTQMNERQKDAAKRCYDVLIWFLEEFSNTDGFNSWWLDFKEQGSQNPEDDIYERITQMEERVRLVIEQEYFDLHDHEIYDAFCEFAGEDLTNVYNGKVGYAYRFEADGESAPTVWQDYEVARNRLNEIIERYV